MWDEGYVENKNLNYKKYILLITSCNKKNYNNLELKKIIY